MNKDFDFDKVGKRMPYTTPDGFFDKLEEDIWKEVKSDCQAKADDKPVMSATRPTGRNPFKSRSLLRSVIAVAAFLALVLVFSIDFSKQSPATINDVDQAFSQLITDDQAYLLDIYQDDVFIQ